MAVIAIDFEWGVAADGYEIVEAEGVTLGGVKAADRQMIRPRGERFRRIRPLSSDSLYLAFASLDPARPADILDFVKHHGLLGFWLAGSEEERWSAPDDLHDWQEQIRHLKRLVELQKSGKLKGDAVLRDRDAWLARADIGLQITPGQTHPALRIRPSSLLSGIRIQFAQLIAGGGDIKSCVECGNWFEVGGRSRKRADAEFCQSKCRNDYYNARR